MTTITKSKTARKRTAVYLLKHKRDINGQRCLDTSCDREHHHLCESLYVRGSLTTGCDDPVIGVHGPGPRPHFSPAVYITSKSSGLRLIDCCSSKPSSFQLLSSSRFSVRDRRHQRPSASWTQRIIFARKAGTERCQTARCDLLSLFFLFSDQQLLGANFFWWRNTDRCGARRWRVGVLGRSCQAYFMPPASWLLVRSPVSSRDGKTAAVC